MEIKMFKKTVLKAAAIAVLLATEVFAAEEASKQFEMAWQNPAYTQIELEPVDVNDVISKYYTTSKPVHFTQDMLWDMERRKAWDPKTYIPHVVSKGHSWGRENLENGDESFIRWSMQRQWKTGKYGMVIEQVLLLKKEKKAIFIGMAQTVDDLEKTLKASSTQPLFHVEHGVTGTFDKPLNTWRIVHLTKAKDQELIDKFKKYRDPTTLPVYVVVYIEKVLGVNITKN
jgi:hypothetical protein